MTNPSAEGRISSSEDLFTEEDVQLVLGVLTDPSERGPARDDAVEILTLLAAAGRLLPLGAEHHEEIGVRVDVAHPRRKEKAGTVMTHFPRENALRAPEIWSGWSVVRRIKIDYAGPWTEVDRSTDA